MDKSRSTQVTDTRNTVNKLNKSRSIPRASLSNKSTKIEKPSEIDICNDDISISVLYGHRESLSSVTPDQQRIPCKNKRNKNSGILIMRNKLFKNQSTQVKGQKRILYLM